VTEERSLKGSIVERELQNFQQLPCCVEIEQVEEHLSHMQLGLQKFVTKLETRHERVDSLLVVFINLLLINLEHIEGCAKGIRFDRIYKELHLKFDFTLLEKDDRQSKSSCQNENLDYLLWNCLVEVVVQEF